MKKAALFIIVAALLSSCGVTTTSLYNWGSTSGGVSPYESLSYLNYDKQTAESICKLLVLYEDMTAHPGGSRNVPAPGICAEYGYLLMQPEVLQTFTENATKAQLKVYEGQDLATYFTEHGKEMFEKEMEYYPESATFIAPLLKKFSSK